MNIHLAARWCRLLPLLVLALLCTRASAQVVSFNFMEDYNTTNVNFGPGAASDPGNTFWNRVGPNNGAFPQNRATMFASDGTTPTSIRVTFSGSDFGTGAAHLFADDLFRGYYYSYGVAAPFTISGLSIGQTYDVYFYSETGTQGADWAANFTLNGNTLNLTAVFANSYVEGDNYVRFTVTPNSTSLSGSFQVTGSSGVAVFSGMQVVTAVPEPLTSASICGAIALAGVVLRRRQLTARAA